LYSSNKENRFAVKIEINYSVSRVSELYITQAQEYARAGGMVSISAYGLQRLKSTHLGSSLGYDAIMEALPYALGTVMATMAKLPPQIGEAAVSRTLPFPNEEIVSRVLGLYLSLDEIPALKRMADAAVLNDLPLVSLWIEELEKKNPPGKDAQGYFRPGEKFLRSISAMTADILCISLFNSSLDSLLLYYTYFGIWNHQDGTYHLGFPRMVKDAICRPCEPKPDRQPNPAYSIESILDWTFQLIGHDIKNNNPLTLSSWAMSSYKGQVLFPTAFENLALPQNAYLALCCAPGVMRFKDQSYEFASGGHPNFPLKNLVPSPGHNPSQSLEHAPRRTLDLFADHKLVWLVTPVKSGLEIKMGWNGSSLMLSPLNALLGFSIALVVNHCTHGPSSLAGELDATTCPFVCPTQALDPANRGAVHVVPVKVSSQILGVNLYFQQLGEVNFSGTPG
jgi:hypothetical protein